MLKSFFHITLVFIVLANAMGITINKHFCQAQLKAIAVFATPQSCHDDTGHLSCGGNQQQKSCCLSTQQEGRTELPAKGCCVQTHQNSIAASSGCTTNTSGDDNCCHNETEWLQSDIDFVFSIIHKDIRPIYTFTILPSLFCLVKEDNSVSFSPHQQIPLLSLQRNLPVLLQTFLC